jgi:hypothetical protein
MKTLDVNQLENVEMGWSWLIKLVDWAGRATVTYDAVRWLSNPDNVPNNLSTSNGSNGSFDEIPGDASAGA